MKIDVLFPALPPELDGIGDHTALLSAGLAKKTQEVRVLTAQEGSTPIDGVNVVRAFSLDRRSDVKRIVDYVDDRRPDWLFVQFNQFSYGRWGLNLHLPKVLHQIADTNKHTRIAWMAHEDFVPPRNWKLAIMRTWQKYQFRELGRAADLVLFSIDPWVTQYRDWFPDARVEHLPVGSNIPKVEASRTQVRESLGIQDDTLVMGYFGTMHGSRLLGHVRAALQAIRAQRGRIVVLYVGPHGDALQNAVGDTPVIDAGRLDAEDVSRHFAAMDLNLVSFMGGVSSRRGSFLVGLQHAVATVGNMAEHTGSLADANGTAFLLSDTADIDGYVRDAVALATDAERRAEIALGGQKLFERDYTWPVLTDRLISYLS